MNWPRWWKNWKTRWTYRTCKICESFQSPCTKDSPSARHAKLREKTRNRGYQPSSSASSHTAFGSRQSSLSGGGRGKGKVQQKKLVTRCCDCNLFGHRSGDPDLSGKRQKMMRKHMLRVVFCRKQCMFVLSNLSRAQSPLNKNSEEPEHATLVVIAPLQVRSGRTTVSIHSMNRN